MRGHWKTATRRPRHFKKSKDKMATAKMSVKRRVEDLDMKILKHLSMLLNPRMVCGGDWRDLAGKFGMKYMQILNIDERERNPTLAVLKDWWAEAGDRTVSVLLGMLTDMKRADCVRLLEPFEYYEIATESHPSENGPKAQIENSDDESSMAVPNPASERPAFLAVESGTASLTNGHQPGPSRTTYKASPSENISSSSAYVIGSSFVDPRSEDESTNVEMEPQEEAPFHGRGSQRSPHVTDMSVQTQIPSPTVGVDAPKFPSPGQETMRREEILNSTKIIAPHDKIALVIGNQNYFKKEYDKLSYTHNDAYDIANALSRLGFKVLSMVDLTLTEMRTAMLAFCRLLGSGIYAVIYYAGHGFELDGENYMIPVDVTSADPNESIRAQEFLQEMQICDTLLNLMFLDCCRTRAFDNKNPRCSLKRKTRGNTIIAYSCCTQHGAFEEPDQKNGVYARHLLQHIERDERVEKILMDVSSAVVSSRSVDQRPTFESDAYQECRLTSPIFTENEANLMRERCELWQDGNCLPLPMVFDCCNGSFETTLKFHQAFSNVLITEVFVASKIQRRINNLSFLVQVFAPLRVELCVDKTKPVMLEPFEQDRYLGFFKIFGLQKLYNESLFLPMEFEHEEAHDIKKIDFGRPLISGITGSFHDWIKDRKYEMPSSSWV